MSSADQSHQAFMAHALKLAQRAWGQTHPNPMVGAVIVEQGQIVAEGWHHAAGQPHAEIEALQALGRKPASTEYTYFILLTANVQGKETYMEAMQAGIDDFLAKPLDRDQIWMRLKVAERILRYTTEISHLESMLPICSYCKKVRDDNNYWQQVETYISLRTGASFSHSVCPSFYTKKVKPQLDVLKK